MTRGSGMTETRWSLHDSATTPGDTIDVESLTPSAPPISSYRAMYRHATPVGASPSGQDGTAGTVGGISPDHHLPTPMNTIVAPSSLPLDLPSSESIGFSPTDWAFRTTSHNPHHHHHHNFAMDLSRVQIKPNATNTVSNSVSSSESDLFKRSVNERLDRYMVIRQRTFHGLHRSKSDLTRLPLVDPRETMSEGSTPTWLHRSKTDLYIEKWRSKVSAKNSRQRSQSGTAASLDLSGMTFGSLYESLPSSRIEKAHSSSTSRSSRKEVKFAPRATSTTAPNTKAAVASNGSETRFPPLTTNSNKNQMTTEASDSLHERLGNVPEASHIPAPAPSPTKEHRLSSPKKTSPTSKVFKLPSEYDEYDDKMRDMNSAAHHHHHQRLSKKSGDVTRPSFGGDGGVGIGETNEGQNDAQKLLLSGARGDPERKNKDGKDVAAIPLQLWEPSFDCVVGVDGTQQKSPGLQPRHLVRAWQHGQRGGVRQGTLK